MSMIKYNDMIEYIKYFGFPNISGSGFGSFMKTNKTAQIGAIGAGVGLLGGSLIARNKAKKEADKQGLTGSERSSYIRNQTLKGGAIGAAGGAALGAGGMALKNKFSKPGSSDLASQAKRSAESVGKSSVGISNATKTSNTIKAQLDTDKLVAEKTNKGLYEGKSQLERSADSNNIFKKKVSRANSGITVTGNRGETQNVGVRVLDGKDRQDFMKWAVQQKKNGVSGSLSDHFQNYAKEKGLEGVRLHSSYFSDRKFNKKSDKRRIRRNKALAMGSTYMAIQGRKKVLPIVGSKIVSGTTSQDHRLTSKLIPTMIKGKTVVIENPNAMYLPGDNYKSFNDSPEVYRVAEHVFKKRGIAPSAFKKIVDKAHNYDHVILMPKSGKQSTQHVLAHELGHAKGGKIQDLREIGNTTNILAIPSATAGIHGGYHTEMAKLTGKKVNAFRKAQGFMIPTANMALNLVGETQASVRGYKALKSLGATKSELSRAKKDLARAGSTYLVSNAYPIVLGIGNRYIGKKLAQHDFKKDLKKLHPDWTDAQLNAEIKKLRSKNQLRNKL